MVNYHTDEGYYKFLLLSYLSGIYLFILHIFSNRGNSIFLKYQFTYTINMHIYLSFYVFFFF